MQNGKRYKPYARYKESGVEWLNEIPFDWRLQPLWTMYRRSKRVGHAEQDLLSVYRDHGVVLTSSRNDNFNRPSDDLSTYQLVKPHDLVINKMKAWQGSIAVSGHEGIVSPAYHIYVPQHDENHRYIHYLLRSSAYRSAYMRMSKGIRVSQWDLEPGLFSRIRILLPTKSEQRAIADFLDRETAKIDELIAKKQRLIELLEEKRAALITHAVTRGLNPDAPLRDSDIEWLGQIPAHWEVRPLKRCGRVVGGTGFPDEYQWLSDEELPFYKVAELGKSSDGRTVGDSSHTISPDTASELGAEIIPPNSIVYAKIGAALLLNRRRLTTRPCCIDNNMSAFIPDKVNPEWSLLWMSILDFRELANPGAVPSLSEGYQVTLPFAVPPDPEQCAIVAKVRQTTDRLDGLRRKILIAIDRLKEYRTALITAGVIGKIDVRSATSN